MTERDSSTPAESTGSDAGLPQAATKPSAASQTSASVGDPVVASSAVAAAAKPPTGELKPASSSPPDESRTLPAKPAEGGGQTTGSPKIRTGRIPKPLPRGHDGATMAVDTEDPISTDTISLKRPVIEPRVSPLKLDVPEKRILKIFCWKCAQKLDLSDMEPFSQIPCPSCQADIIVPKWFDNYLLEERSGEGGMALVFRGLDLALDREVAIKILSPALAKEEQKSNLFLHEARTAATLNHYAVLPIYTCGEFEGQPYIVMQWMGGGSLDVKLENGEQLPVRDVVKWIRDIAEGLDNARRHGIIHHDVKPANIMMDADGNVKIGDFGISQALHDVRSEKLRELTKAWASPHYVSPEKVSTGKESYLGDIYSLGAACYHLLTGREPFAEELELTRLIRMRLEQDPPEPRSLRPEIPESVSTLVMAMMSRTPETRPGYRDIVNDLNAVIKGARVVARPVRSGKDGGPPVAPRIKLAPQQHDFGKSLDRLQTVNRSPAGVFAAVLVGALLVIGLVYWFSHGSGGGPSPAPTVVATVNDHLPAVTRAFALGDTRQALALAERTLDDADASPAERRQAAVQAALAVYLNRANPADNYCRLIAGRLTAAGDGNTPAAAVVGFLAGRSVVPEIQRRQLANAPRGFQAALEMAAFLKVLYERVPQDQIQQAYSAYHQAALQLPDDQWAAVWRGRVGRWVDWIISGRGNPEELEPLIQSFKPPEVGALPPGIAPTPTPTPGTPPPVPPSAADINRLTAEWLAARRGFADRRPRPLDYNFNQNQFQAYVAQVPAEFQAGERKRHQQASSLKPYLCKMMMRFSYDGGSILLRNGKRLSGSVMSNENYLSIRVSGGRQRVQWSEIPVEQMAAFLEYYAKLRLGATAGTVTDQERSLEGARDYLRVALLYDWYGNYPEAVRMARLAIATDLRTVSEVRSLLME